MTRLIILTFLHAWQISYAQTSKLIDIPTYTNNTDAIDTSAYYKHCFQLTHQLHLPDLLKTNHSFYFRFWTDTQVIDLWAEDTVTCFGSVTEFAERYDRKLLKKAIIYIDTVFYKTKSLASAKAKKIYQLIVSLNIDKIPTSEKIKGWGDGLDGQEYLVEQSLNNNYSFKQYWTPYVFREKLIEANKLQLLIDYLFKELKLGEYVTLKLPPGNYRGGSGIPGVQIIKDYNANGRRAVLDGF